MADATFRLVCTAAALAGTPREWARELLADGELALLGAEGGLAAVDQVAHHLDLPGVLVLRGEDTAAAQDETVIAYAGALPLVWIGPTVSDRVSAWARDRGPMTLLVAAHGALPEDEQRRIARFVASLGRQSE